MPYVYLDPVSAVCHIKCMGRWAHLPVYRNHRRGIARRRIKAESGNHAPRDEATSSPHPPRPGPYGAKGLGEGGAVAVAPAVAGAIYQATGVRIKEVPPHPGASLANLARLQGLRRACTGTGAARLPGPSPDTDSGHRAQLRS